MNLWDFIRRLAIVPEDVSHGEKAITAIGCFLGILVVTLLSSAFVSGYGLPVLIASMGASSILVFAVPHGPFSQPWSVIGGQIVSALTGITCLMLIPDPLLAGSIAVAMAGYLMYQLRCLHPPGGATALAAVLGGAEISHLGYQYALTPVALDALVLITMGLILNNILPGRSYPARLPEAKDLENNPDMPTPVITPEDLEFALQKMDTYIDTAREDLIKIYMYAHQHAYSNNGPSSNFRIKTGHCYSNGEYGTDWLVRQVISIAPDKGNSELDRITYRIITNKNNQEKINCTRKDMTQWAQYEVFRK